MDSASSVAGRYFWLLVLGVAIGFFEASVVVYLRALYYPEGFRFPIRLATAQVATVEILREVASLVLLAAAARLAGRFALERCAAFMLLFGVWDLTYYVFLRLVLGWPPSLFTWDILFLIPVPWVGPVWAPCAVSLALCGVGTHLLWTAQRSRRVAALDWAIEALAGFLVIVALTAEWRVVPEERVPQHFPGALFWAGWLLGLAWFARFERRARRAPGAG